MCFKIARGPMWEAYTIMSLVTVTSVLSCRSALQGRTDREGV